MATEHEASQKQKLTTQERTDNEQTALKAVRADITTFEILFVLKNYSSKEHPLSVSEIRQKLYSTVERHNLRDKLDGLSYIFNAGSDFSHGTASFSNALSDNDEHKENADDVWCYYTAALLRASCGGVVRTFQKTKGGWKKYYFDPLLNDSWLDMIINSLITNQYLSDEERNYLINVLATLNSIKENHLPMVSAAADELDFCELCELIPSQQETGLSDEAFRLLRCINTIYFAIVEGYQIEIVYGSYQKQKGTNLPALLPKDNKKQILNPYAILTNDGHQYLIVTHNGHDNPTHYRVDRIYSVELVKDQEDARKYQNRALRPKSLQDFYLNNAFQKELYIKKHPLMSIYQENSLSYCILECLSVSGLNVVVDAFGKDNVTILSVENNADNTNTIYQVGVTAEPDSIVLFCQQQSRIITLRSPDRLVQKVTEYLQESLTRYQHLQAAKADDTLPQ